MVCVQKSAVFWWSENQQLVLLIELLLVAPQFWEQCFFSEAFLRSQILSMPRQAWGKLRNICFPRLQAPWRPCLPYSGKRHLDLLKFPARSDSRLLASFLRSFEFMISIRKDLQIRSTCVDSLVVKACRSAKCWFLCKQQRSNCLQACCRGSSKTTLPRASQLSLSGATA